MKSAHSVIVLCLALFAATAFLPALASSAQDPIAVLDKDASLVLSPRDISEFRGVNEVEFIWLKVPGATQYHFILAKDRRFKKVIHEGSVPDTSYIVGNLDLGTYFFRVVPLSADQRTGDLSETLSLIVVPPPPVKTPAVN